MVHLLQSKSQYWRTTMNQSPQFIQILVLNILFFVAGSQLRYHIIITCPISSSPSWLWQFLSFLVFIALDGFEEDQSGILQDAHLLGFVSCSSSWLDWGYMFLRGRPQSKHDLSSHPINMTCHFWCGALLTHEWHIKKKMLFFRHSLEPRSDSYGG